MLLKGIVHQMGLCWQRLTVRTHSDGQLEIILDLFTRILLFGICLSHGSPARSFVRIRLSTCPPAYPSVHLPIRLCTHPSVCPPAHPDSHVLRISSQRQVSISAYGPLSLDPESIPESIAPGPSRLLPGNHSKQHLPPTTTRPLYS